MSNINSNVGFILFRNRCHLYICYTECDFLYFFSKYGSYKVKLNLEYICLLYDSFYSIFSSVFFFFYHNYLFVNINFFSHLLFSKFLGITFGFIYKYKIKGLGYRLYIFKSSYIFRLGYSHNVYFLLPLNIFGTPKRHKKQNFFTIRSIDNISILNILSIIQSFRLPDIYSRNGIFKRNDFFFLKVGKKSFML